MAASSYQKLSIAQKRALDLSRVRDRAIRCPGCDQQILPSDLLSHLDLRCTGSQEPGDGAKWVTWREALALGLAKWRLSYWARTNKVRFRGSRGDRTYLLRDLVLRLASERLDRRRELQSLQPKEAQS